MTRSTVDRYRQDLSIAIIGELTRKMHIDLRTATDVFYRSRLAAQISTGQYGIDNLDYKYLANDLMENETELFSLPKKAVTVIKRTPRVKGPMKV